MRPSNIKSYLDIRLYAISESRGIMSNNSILKIVCIAIIVFAIPHLGMNAYANDTPSTNTGVYHTETVSSFDECRALCQADTQCRGMQAHQADTRYPVMTCELNNGFGKKSPFPNTPPEPLNLSIALADFNSYRRSKGLKPVSLNAKLNAASQVHAQDLAVHGNISHTGSDGTSHSTRIKRQGYNYALAAENVATGQKSWKKVFKAWQDSPGHNENLLLGDVREFGIALVYEPSTTYQTYWVMLVASRL